RATPCRPDEKDGKTDPRTPIGVGKIPAELPPRFRSRVPLQVFMGTPPPPGETPPTGRKPPALASVRANAFPSAAPPSRRDLAPSRCDVPRSRAPVWTSRSGDSRSPSAPPRSAPSPPMSPLSGDSQVFLPP